MRISLIESGGFVGVSLRYEVDVSALGPVVLSALEQAAETVTAERQPAPTSAGGVSIRMELDDGSVKELTLSNAAPIPEIAELVQRLRACATIVRNRA